VITGANMGGKSLTLKTLLLNVTLAQLGFFVFADYVSLPVLDYIYMIMDDLQSVNRGLSSFGAEIKALDEAIDLSLSGRGLIVMDELARGTNPQEGKAIVNAVVRFLNDKDTFSVISTHYDSIDLKDVVQYRVRGLKI
jgi:Mismatch repair ATPase (MutS family)